MLELFTTFFNGNCQYTFSIIIFLIPVIVYHKDSFFFSRISLLLYTSNNLEL